MADTPDQRQMTTDRNQIKAWADQRDAVPVAVEDPDEPYRFYRREELTDEHSPLEWEAFFEAFEDGEMVFVYHEDTPPAGELGFYQLSEREQILEQANLERGELEQSLREGETVTTELVETRVVEAEIIETDTIESTITDATVIERDIVDSELLEREVVDTEFIDDNRIAVDIDEMRLDTIEEIERLTVESEIVDVDVEERGEIELEEIRSSVNDETIQRAILNSDVVRTSGPADEILDRGRIHTQREEGEGIISHVVERRMLEEDVRARNRLVYTVEESELLETEVLGSELLEAEIVDVEEYADREETMAATEQAGAPEAGVNTGETMAAGTDPGPADQEAAEAGGHTLTEDDQGKEVIDEAGEQVGIVATVESETFYIDPEPGFTDRLKARFNWGDPDQDAYPVNTSQIATITDDEVVLSSHEETDEMRTDDETELGSDSSEGV